MSTFTIDIPESIFSSFKKTPKEFIHELKIAAAVKWYELGEISQNRAADIAELSRSEFISALYKYQVSVLQYTEEIIEYELNNAQK